MGEAKRRKLLGLPPRKDKSKLTPKPVVNNTPSIHLRTKRQKGLGLAEFLILSTMMDLSQMTGTSHKKKR